MSQSTMKNRRLRRAVALFLAVSLLVGGVISCVNSMRLAPGQMRGCPLKDIKEIVAVTVAGEQHLFVKGEVQGSVFRGVSPQGEERSIPLDTISHFILRRAGMSKAAVVGTAVALGVLATAGIITGFYFILTNISCPYVYSYDGKRWVLEAEPNAGAIAKNAQYEDLSRLSHLRPDAQGIYRLQVTNESEEVDHIDQLSLVLVDHRPGLQIIPDARGTLHPVHRQLRPHSARTRGGVDLTRRMDRDGKFFWDGEPWIDFDSSRPREELVLKYRVPPRRSGKAVLVFEGYNTLWSQFIMAHFLRKFGKSAKDRLDALDDHPQAAEKVRRFQQKIGALIEVQLREGDRWRPVGHLKSVGMQVSKTQALPLELPASGDVVLRLRWAPLFWNLQRVNIGLADNEELAVTELVPHSAIDLVRGDVRKILSHADGKRHVMQQGDRVLVTFQAVPRLAERQRTFLLRSQAYYKPLLDESKGGGLMERMRIIIKRQGIDSYSLEKYQPFLRAYRGR